MPKVGYQDGLKAAYNRIKKLDPEGCNPNYNPDNPDAIPVDQLKAWDKVHRTLKILKEDHDAAIPSNGGSNPPPDPEPTDPHYGIAPRTYNYAESNNSDPLFCTDWPGVEDIGDGLKKDKFSRYREGRDIDGGRDRLREVPGLNDADSVDGRPICQLYNGLKEWPEESFLR
jgi:hypothetical protein